MRQFVPLTDDMLFAGGGLPGPLVPYRAGVACWHALGDNAQSTPIANDAAPAATAKATRLGAATAPAPYTSAASACP